MKDEFFIFGISSGQYRQKFHNQGNLSMSNLGADYKKAITVLLADGKVLLYHLFSVMKCVAENV